MDQPWTWWLIGAAGVSAIELYFLNRQRRIFFSESRAASPASWWGRWMLRCFSAVHGATERAVMFASAPRAEPEHAVQHVLAAMGNVPPAVTRSLTPPAEPSATLAAVVDAASGAPRPLDGARDVGDEAARGAVPSHVAEVTAHGAGEHDTGIVYVDLAGRVTFATETARDLLDWQSGEIALGDMLAGGDAECAALLNLVARQEAVDQSLVMLASGGRQRFDVSALALRDRTGAMFGAALFLRRPAAVPTGAAHGESF
jgi:hypothetical protein